MRKKIWSIALVFALSLGSVSGVYGADFSSGFQETVPEVSAESIFSSGDGDVLYEAPVPEVNVQNEDADTAPSSDETVPNTDGMVSSEDEEAPEAGEVIPEQEDREIFAANAPEETGTTQDGDTGAEKEGEILTMADFQYMLTDSKVTIIRFLGDAETVEIPETINGYPVTGIGEEVFAEGTVKQVKLPKSIIIIHERAFSSCTDLIIYCYEGSYAQKYAAEKHITCQLIQEKKADIKDASVTVAASAVCTGQALEPAVKVSYDGQELTPDKDYSVEYTNNVNPGTATVTVTGKGSYEGTITKNFKITLATPALVSAASASYRSIKVTWKPVAGATSYNVYYKGGTVKSWKRITSVTGTSYVHTSSTSYPLVTGTKYTYTVRAVYGKITSGYVQAGKSAVPTLGTAKLGTVKSAAYNKLTITWTKVAGASGYYIYRKSGNSWQNIGKASGTSYTHTSSAKYPVKTGVTYTYTVKAFRKVGTKNVYGGYDKTGIKGKTVPGRPELVSVECTGEGKITIRWKKAAGATNYLVYRKDSKGKWQLIKNISGEKMIGYTHVSSKKYPIVTGKSYTYTVRSYTTTGKTYGLYNTKGISVKAQTKVEQQNEAALNNAKKIVSKITNSGMSSSQKLKACFDWVISKPYVTRRTFVNTPGWPAVFANDHFVLGGGNCHSDAAAFAYLAKALGYKNVYVCTDSSKAGSSAHSWAEVNGLVYDPLFAEAKNYSRYYGASYSRYELSPILHIAI